MDGKSGALAFIYNKWLIGFLVDSIVPGAGSVEIQLAKKLSSYADVLPGLEQYSVRKFAAALETFPKALADNSGVNGSEIINKLYSDHSMGHYSNGFDIESQSPATVDVTKTKIYDLFVTKHWGLRFAVEAASTVLRVNQIIMAKRAGGPKPRQQAADNDDDWMSPLSWSSYH